MSVVSDFLTAYEAHFASQIDQGTLTAEESALRWIEGQRLVASKLTASDLSDLERRYGVHVPPDIAEFWTRQGTRRPLEAPLMDLFPAGASTARETLEESLEILASPGLLPVGIERDDFGLGYYCVKRDEVGCAPVVYAPHPRLERGSISDPLFGSFGGMLKVMTYLMKHVVSTPLSALELDELRRMDPVFGREAWGNWWQRRLVWRCTA
jgi:hypothetical protein